jgi:hypothetical protein
MKMPSFLKDLMTTKDGVSYDPIRVGLVVTVLSLLAFTGWDVIANSHPFDALNFCGGAGALFGGAGLGIGAKRKDEPDA